MLSGDSTVKSFSFDGEKVQFEFHDYETEKVYNVIVDTPIVYSESPGDEGCVHMKIESSLDKMPIDKVSGLFVLPGDFKKQMAIINKGYHVLAGLKSSVYMHVFILRGTSKIIVCPIKDQDSVRVANA
ncbi:MAG: hypothetical protein MI976_10485 [Pseudomonadales bacterium]|nr:hypothetical protein [Pseudomonadales bacterium]